MRIEETHPTVMTARKFRREDMPTPPERVLRGIPPLSRFTGTLNGAHRIDSGALLIGGASFGKARLVAAALARRVAKLGRRFIKRKGAGQSQRLFPSEKSNRLSRLQFFAELPNGTRAKRQQQQDRRQIS
jgi:hypothetical protein